MAVVIPMEGYDSAGKFRDFCCGPGDRLVLKEQRPAQRLRWSEAVDDDDSDDVKEVPVQVVMNEYTHDGHEDEQIDMEIVETESEMEPLEPLEPVPSLPIRSIPKYPKGPLPPGQAAGAAATPAVPGAAGRLIEEPFHETGQWRREHRKQLARQGVKAPAVHLPIADGPVVDGKKWCKLLVPLHFAGGMIGKGGRVMADFEKQTQCNVRISPPNVCFPGTQDRMLAIGAPDIESLQNALDMLLISMIEINANQHGQHFVLKMPVPKSAVSKIIGTKGVHAKEMAQRTGCRISISKRIEGIQERLVTLKTLKVVLQTEVSYPPSQVLEEDGLDGLIEAAKLIVEMMQYDPHLPEHMHFSYDVELPYGIWDCKTGPSEPDSKLLSPEEASQLPKRAIVENLQKAAPREILIQHRLLGKMKKTLKAKTHEQVMEVVKQAWQMRHFGEVPERPVERPADRAAERSHTKRERSAADAAGMAAFIYPAGPLPLRGQSEGKDEEKKQVEVDDSSQSTDTPSPYGSGSQDEDIIQYPSIDSNLQGSKESKKIDCGNDSFLAAGFKKLMQAVMNADEEDREKMMQKLLNDVNPRYLNSANYTEQS